MVLTRRLTFLFVKLLIYGAIGIAAIVLASVVLSLASVLLAFALVGFLLWMPVHSLVVGNKFLFRKLFENVSDAGHRMGLKIRIRSENAQLRVKNGFCGLARKVRSIAPFVVEPICGCLIGCVLVWLRSPNASVEPLPMVIGGILGAGAGLFVAVAGIRGGRQGEISETA